MTVLIVDDEEYSALGIRDALPWAQMGIDEVFVAFTMAEAQARIEQTPVDILLCDIEMPKGSGLDLVSWVRNNGLNIVCIFFTSYAKFDYASRAVKLQGFDYILKPAPYETVQEVLLRALERVKRDQAEKILAKQASYWSENQQNLSSLLWRRIIDGTIPAGEEEIRREVIRFHLDKSLLSEKYVIGLIQAYPLEDNRSSGRLTFSADVVEKLTGIFPEDNAPIIVPLSDRRYLLVLRAGEQEGICALCEKAASQINGRLTRQILFRLSASITIFEASDAWAQLVEEAKTYFFDRSGVFISRAKRPDETESILPERWADLLMENKGDALYRQAEQTLRSGTPVERGALLKVRHALLQSVYTVFEKRGVSACESIPEAENDLYEHAFDSIEDMLKWVQFVIDVTQERLEQLREAPSLMEDVRMYLKNHEGEDISRREIAQALHMHPDHLSHLFRKKAGVTLSGFILNERIREARALLMNTDMPVRDIAIQTGMPNFSYFSKQFKRLTGVTPHQYRISKRNTEK